MTARTCRDHEPGEVGAVCCDTCSHPGAVGNECLSECRCEEVEDTTPKPGTTTEDTIEVLQSRLAQAEWDREEAREELGAVATELERFRAELGDLRHALALRAVTAPDADDETMLASLDARINDALSRTTEPVSGITDVIDTVWDSLNDSTNHGTETYTYVDVERAVRDALSASSGTAALTDEYRELLGCIWLYVDWRYVTKQLTTEQKNLWADAVDNFGDPENRGAKADRWWRPRQCTCGHDAERHLVLSVDPPPGCRDCECNWFLDTVRVGDGDV
jgi:hypothetical protein